MRTLHHPGFTLAEVLLAVVLLAVGMTALASMATAAARTAGDAKEMTAAALLAGTVLDSLRATPCRAISGGSTASGPATVRWTVRPDSLSRHVLVTVELQRGVSVRTWAIETLMPCDR